MEPDKYFIATAQISLAIAGFAGIVASYRNESVHEWRDVERFWLRLLLFNAILPFIFSLSGIFFLATGPHPITGWRFLSGFAAICLVPYSVMIIRSVRGFAPGALRAAGSGMFVSYALVSVLIATCLLQIWNAVAGSAFWPFFGAILALIIGAVFQFVRLILKPQRLRPEEPSDEISEEE
jgi:MFS family permease